MSIVEWLLLHGADLATTLWSGGSAGLGWLASAFHSAFQPILSPMFAFLNPPCTAVGDFVYRTLAPFPVWTGLTILSIFTGVISLIAFRYLSNQTAIAQAKDDIKANLLALKLYKDELHVTFTAQWQLLKAIVRLQRYVLTPVIILLLPMLLMLSQMGIRYQWRPLRPGEQTILTVTLTDTLRASGTDASGTTNASRTDTKGVSVSLEPHPGIAVEVDSIPGGGQIVWRIRATLAGRHQLRFHVGAQTITKELVVSQRFERVSARRVGPDWTEQMLHPAEDMLPDDTGIQAIEVLYPGSSSWFHGPNWWIATFFLVSMGTAIVLKPIFRVRF